MLELVLFVAGLFMASVSAGLLGSLDGLACGVSAATWCCEGVGGSIGTSWANRGDQEMFGSTSMEKP